MPQHELNGKGRMDAPFLFVYTSPPSEKMNSWLLRKLLDCKIQSTDCRFVSLLNEAPKGANGGILRDQHRDSWPRFAREIQESKPKVVVPLGSAAFYALTGIEESIFHSRGYLIPSNFFRKVEHEEYAQIGTYKTNSKASGARKGDPKYRWIKVTDNPPLADFSGYVIPIYQLDHIRAEAFTVEAALNADLIRARRAVEGDLHRVDDAFTYESSLSEKVKQHEWGQIIAVDVETHGIDNEVLDCVSFSDGEMSATIPWTQEARDYISYLFNLPGHIYALHNSPFDTPRLKQAGVNISNHVERSCIFDTMFAAVVLQPDLLKGLGAVAPMYLDVYPWKWRSLSEANPEFYSAKDAYVTALLARVLMGIAKGLGCYDLLMGTGRHPGPGVMGTISMLTRVSREGILTDRKAAQEWCHHLDRRLMRLMKLWNNNFADVRPSSNPDVKNLFYKTWGFPIQKTKDGGASVDELACMRLREYAKAFKSTSTNEGWQSDPKFTPRLFDLLLAIRETAKALGTYAQPVAESEQNRVHPQYLPAAKDREHGSRSKSKGNTATGRLVAYDPNIQNQPKTARKLFVPDGPDLCFVQADYVRAEPHVMAYSANDHAMIADLKAGDLYERLRERLLKMGHRNIVRKTCKNVFLAGQYLAGAPKVSEMILKQDHVYVPPEECKAILNGIANVYHDVAAFKQYLVIQCEQRGHIVNPFGRTRFFYDRRAAAAVDFWPQSTVGDLMWCVMRPVDDLARSLGGRFVLQVHDSILVEVPKDQVTRVISGMREIMEQKFHCIRQDFFIPVDFETGAPGASWGEMRHACI